MFSFPLIPAPSQRCEQFWQAIHLGKNGFDAHWQSLYDEFGSERVCRILLSQSRVCAACLKRWLLWPIMYSTTHPYITHEHLAMIFKKSLGLTFLLQFLLLLKSCIWSSVFFFLISPEHPQQSVWKSIFKQCEEQNSYAIDVALSLSLLIFIYPSFGCCLQ